jgi:hypothetical protein
MSPRSDLLGELSRLVKIADDGHVLGAFLLEHVDVLAPLLGTTSSDLQSSIGMTDREIASRISKRLAFVVRKQREQRVQESEPKVAAAVQHCIDNVRWLAGAAHIPPNAFFARELWSKPHVVFVCDDFEVAVTKHLVLRARDAMRAFHDVRVFVDAKGLQVRWRGDKGRMTLYPQQLSPAEKQQALVIALPANPQSVTRECA